MVRAPCCEAMGLKKGPWTPEEDHILVSYIRTHGHGNWRALPKQAGNFCWQKLLGAASERSGGQFRHATSLRCIGIRRCGTSEFGFGRIRTLHLIIPRLLRCGKSCRLRWTNYLRPDVKRGDFSKEEEDTIIYMHTMLGNRWSAIAAKLPGRTDNEIKNFWHTHLKKRLNPNQSTKKSTPKERKKNKVEEEKISTVFVNNEPSFFEINTENNNMDVMQKCINDYFDEYSPEIEEFLWSEAFTVNGEEEESSISENFSQQSLSNDDAISFWMNLLAESGNLESF